MSKIDAFARHRTDFTYFSSTRIIAGTQATSVLSDICRSTHLFNSVNSSSITPIIVWSEYCHKVTWYWLTHIFYDLLIESTFSKHIIHRALGLEWHDDREENRATLAQDYNNEDEDYRVVARKYWDCLRPERSNITYLDIEIQICKLNMVIRQKELSRLIKAYYYIIVVGQILFIIFSSISFVMRYDDMASRSMLLPFLCNLCINSSNQWLILVWILRSSMHLTFSYQLCNDLTWLRYKSICLNYSKSMIF